jgi:hypothetical protein
VVIFIISFVIAKREGPQEPPAATDQAEDILVEKEDDR